MEGKKGFWFFSKDKKGNILTENIIFIVLNLAFLSILILFLFSKVGDASVFEEKYAKQIALLIDSAEPVSKIEIKMEEAMKEAENKEYEGEIVNIQNNIVTVKFKEGKGYSYSFFNNVDARAYCSILNKNCTITINKK